MPRFCMVTLATILFINLLAGFIYLRSWRLIPYTLTNTTELEVPIDIQVTISQQELQSTHPHPYNFTLNNKELCSNDTFIVLILVCSAVSNAEQRIAIRETWGSPAIKAANKGGPVRLAFLVGASSNDNVTRSLMEENTRHGDIIQEDFIDSYNNLTLKSIMLLKWVNSYCPKVRYILKCDDDMYVNVPNLVSALRKLGSRTKSIFGVLFRKAKPDRNKSSKWYVPKLQFAGEIFPDYVSGTAYALTRDSISALYNVSLKTPFLVMEDVFITGLCAQSAGIKRLGIRGFTHGKRSANGCSFLTAITGHHVTPKDMYKIWKDLQKNELKCRKRNR